MLAWPYFREVPNPNPPNLNMNMNAHEQERGSRWMTWYFDRATGEPRKFDLKCYECEPHVFDLDPVIDLDPPPVTIVID